MGMWLDILKYYNLDLYRYIAKSNGNMSFLFWIYIVGLFQLIILKKNDKRSHSVIQLHCLSEWELQLTKK